MKYSAYPAYKDSGVEWLGEIPEHWQLKKLKWFASTDSGSTPNSSQYSDYYENGSISWVRTLDLNDGEVRETEIKITKKALKDTVCTILPKGTVMVAMYGGDGTIGKSGILKISAATNQAICSVIPNSTFLPEFIHRYIQFYRPYWMIEAMGARKDPNISQEIIKQLIVTFPPLEEQQAIASFLDRETAKIDALIAKKERLIELLQEERTAIISHAITKGLDPTMPMRDSGVDWLGEVPAHWRVMLLKRVASVRYGLGQPPPEIPDGTPLIRATNVKSGSICEEGMLYVNPENVPESRDAILSPGEIIVVRSGAYTGDSAIIPPEYSGAIAGYDMVLTLKKGFSSFFAWQILSAEVRELQFGFCRMRAAQPHLNAEELGETIVVIPPFPEQQAIASYLDRETAKIDALIAKIREGIEKLKEYRTALISAAVTGKIDVRNEVAS